MDFVVEELSPVRKKIAITAEAAEVDAALDAALRHFRHDLAMPGFRKGKVPASVVERRFAEDMKARVVEEYLGARFEAYLQEAGIIPASRSEYDGGKIERGEGFACTVTFDVIPAFDLPEYVGLSVEQDPIEVSETEIDDMLERLRSNMAEETPVLELRNPVKGDAVTVDFAGFEHGEPVADVKGDHFRVTLGEKQVLPDFETIVYGLKVGEEGEGPVNFPADYGHAPLAGKTITMKVKLNALSARELPEVTEEFAKKMGQDDVVKLREAIATSMRGRKKETTKAAAQQKLIDGLLAAVSFPLPETMVKVREERILGDMRIRLEQQARQSAQSGNSALDEAALGEAALGEAAPDNAATKITEDIESMRPEAHRDAELFARMHILLMSIARKEGLSVSQQEADMQLYSMAMRAGQDYTKMRDAYMRSGLMEELYERLLADKAMDLIYEKAAITTAAAKAEQPGA